MGATEASNRNRLGASVTITECAAKSRMYQSNCAWRVISQDHKNQNDDMPQAAAGSFIDQNEITADGYSWRRTGFRS